MDLIEFRSDNAAGVAPEIVEAIAARPRHVNVIITGRDAAPELIELADTVTEMREIKHAFKAGIKAQAGVEY